MALELAPVTEEDIETWTLVAISAFESGIGHLLVGPNTPENLERKKAGFLHSMRNDPTARFLKIVDTSSGQIIAGASWNIYVDGNTEEALDHILARPTLQRGYRADFEPIYEHLRDNRRRVMGTRPYVYLDLLFTSPKHHRRGAGAMLLKWGVDRADELGIEAYLESSIEGRILYERYGYKVLKAVEFNMADYGRPELGIDVDCIMHRPVRSIT